MILNFSCSKKITIKYCLIILQININLFLKKLKDRLFDLNFYINTSLLCIIFECLNSL